MSLTPARIKELERAEAKLQALENGGVDNWEWYSDSLEEYNKTIQIEEDREDFAKEIIEALGALIYEPSERGAGYAFHDEADTVYLTDIMDRWGVTFKTPRGES